jgi:hypothetical protein
MRVDYVAGDINLALTEGVGALHAAARAVGGCPVYVSDAPGKHDFDVLRQLVFPSGAVLRVRLRV